MKLKSGNWKVLSWSNSLWMSLQFHRFWARGLHAPTTLAFLSRLNWKSKLMSDHRQSNQADSVFCVRRTGPCGYRTLISQTPLVGLSALPICNKLHASFSELLNIGDTHHHLTCRRCLHHWSRVFEQMTCSLYTRKQLDSWHSGEKCLQIVLTKTYWLTLGIFAQTGSCSNSTHV